MSAAAHFHAVIYAIYISSLHPRLPSLPRFYRAIPNLPSVNHSRCTAMDGIYFIGLLLFVALTGALLALCATLGGKPSGVGDGPGAEGFDALRKDSAADRRL